MHFRSQKKTAMDVSLSEMIDTGKDGNALSLMEVIRSDEDLFDDLSNREMYGKLHQPMKTPKIAYNDLESSLKNTVSQVIANVDHYI